MFFTDQELTSGLHFAVSTTYPNYANLTPMDQYQIKTRVAAVLIPVLERLPEGVTASNLEEMELSRMSVTEFLIESLVKQVMAMHPGRRREDVILSVIQSESTPDYILGVFNVIRAFLEEAGRLRDLEDLAKETLLDHDWDSDLEKLLKEN